MTRWEVLPWQSPKIYRSPNFYFLIQFLLKIIFQKELFSCLQKIKHVSNCCKTHFLHFNSSTKSTQTFLVLCHVFLPHERLLKLRRTTWRASAFLFPPEPLGLICNGQIHSTRRNDGLWGRECWRAKRKSASEATHAQTIVYFKANPSSFVNSL